MTGIRQDRRYVTWERMLTEVFQPPIVLSVMFVISSVARDGTLGTLWFGLMAAFLICLVPLSAVVVLARTGQLSDHHVGNRKQRAPVLLATLALSGITVWLLQVLDGPALLTALVLASMVGMVAMILVSLFWKISGHAATLAGSLTVLLLMFGWAALPAVLIPPLVCVSRVRLGDHTVGQVIAGSAAGVALIGLPYYLFSTLLAG